MPIIQCLSLYTWIFLLYHEYKVSVNQLGIKQPVTTHSSESTYEQGEKIYERHLGAFSKNVNLIPSLRINLK